jgi:putative peptidoglycan lipid II flippase
MTTPISTIDSGNALKKSITIASVIMMGSVLLSRVIGMVREMVLAHLLGTNAEMDAYVASFIIPELLNHLLAGGFLSITFIPIYQKYLISKDTKKSWEVFSNLLTIGSVFFAVLILVTMVFTNQIVGIMGHHISSGPERDLTVRLTRIIMPAQLLFYWGAFLMAVQYAHHRFLLPALAPLCYNLGIIVGGWFLYPYIGVEGFAWGVLIGALIGNFALQVPGALRTGLRYKFTFNLRDKDFINYVLVTGPLILGLGMSFSNELFFRFFGSFLGTGGLASINYSLRTMMPLVGVFGQASGVASYPFLSHLAVEKKFNEMNALLNSIVTKISTYLIPISSVMIVLSVQIIAILFEHGRFSHASTLATAPVLVLYLLGALPFAASSIVMRNYYAMQNTLFPMIVCSVIALLSIPGYWILSKYFGAAGIACAASLAMLVQFVLLYGIWSKNHNNLKGIYKVLITMVKIICVSILGAGIAFGLKRYAMHIGITETTFVHNIILCFVSGVPALVVMFVILERMHISSTRMILARVFKR